jgi:hypothetical protein
MTDFIATILEIDKQYGPFDAAVGHSLGGMSILNAIKQGLKLKSEAIMAVVTLYKTSLKILLLNLS